MFYKVVMNGGCRGQDIKNILYYRTGFGFDVAGLTLSGAEALAGNINQEIVPTWRAASSDEYTLESIDVYPINDEFQLAYQMPYSLPVGLPGLATGTIAGPAMCWNVKFMLEPTGIANGIKPPSRGYLAMGPLAPQNVGEDGFLLPAVLANDSPMKQLANKLATNIEQLVPVQVVWFPIRMKQSRILGGLIHWESYADIKGGMVARRASFRRSRMPEA